ncbi:hypothetical protein E2N92_03430 [Methanofollis formosanus]|uniref:Tetratricopeptide repeat protein n=1 Tax=Methanofollis formosanus TaxID=299308 RepID=A0A8G1A0Q0_9EURY|nr:hypothetical protein [Methanofollis formosanus]QYZ78548.1 hypothetical protein E2N92_03430 [Methanofollis formosanus]
MTEGSPADGREEAFALYEAGHYRESIECCNALPGGKDDPSVAVLVVTNYFALGEYDEAEVRLRDLITHSPDSSYYHSFLGKVLETAGKEGGTAAYARAVQLDPGNEEALRAYAAHFTGLGDHRAALPLLSALVSISGKRDDAIALMRSLIETGDGERALEVHASLSGSEGAETEYIDALMIAGRHREAAKTALAAYRSCRDPGFLRQHLAALAIFDRPAALHLFPTFLQECPDDDLALDYVLLLKSEKRCREALEACKRLIEERPDPIHQLVACELVAGTGETDLAQQGYEELIREEIRQGNDLETLSMIIGAYEGFLRKAYTLTTVPGCYLSVVSGDPNVVSLVRTGWFYASFGETKEAREWLYRAYRLDYLNGGVEYAGFLAQEGDLRECEKVLLYVLTHLKKTGDLVRVAETVLEAKRGWQKMQRLVEALITRFSGEIGTLGPEGVEVFARVYLCAAEGALEAGEYVRCKECCLYGLDLTRTHTDEFFDLVARCKRATVAERPVLSFGNTGPAGKSKEKEESDDLLDLELDEREEALVAFLKQHRESNEEELRKVLGTRRVSGTVNRLIKKAADIGISLIEKQGMGEHGEIYVYCGK